MNIKVLTKKPKLKTDDGEEYLDLSYNTFLSDDIFDTILGFEVVNEKTEMRPDLIAEKWYGSSENIDILLKANNIFNPFSIQQGDVIIVPAIGEDGTVYKNPGEIKKSEVREKYKNVTRMSKMDITRLKALVAKNRDVKNKLKDPLPPNMLPEDRNNKKFTEDGQIILTNHHTE